MKKIKPRRDDIIIYLDDRGYQHTGKVLSYYRKYDTALVIPINGTTNPSYSEIVKLENVINDPIRILKEIMKGSK